MAMRRSSEAMQAVKGIILIRSLLLLGLIFCLASAKTTHYHVFEDDRYYLRTRNVKDANYTRLCSSKSILTVNGKYPGPTLYAQKGDRLVIDVYNYAANDSITIHWHGIKQPRNPWSDGPEHITQCPIQPGKKFRYSVILSKEEGTLWWHAHSEWSRATVHGAIVVYPKHNHTYPFPQLQGETVLILGEWWKEDIRQIYAAALQGTPISSDSFTINGQPGDLYPCSRSGTYRMIVKQGKRYLLRIINAGFINAFFFSVADHQLTVVGSDGSYTKPLTSNYILIAPGETMDVLLEANQRPDKRYYMAARALDYLNITNFDNTTTTAILEYACAAADDDRRHNNHSLRALLPSFPNYNDTLAATGFVNRLRSLASKEHPVHVPRGIDRRLFIAVSLNMNQQTNGSAGTRLAASLNNITFQNPSIDILQAYYKHIKGVYQANFPAEPPSPYNYTADVQPRNVQMSKTATKVRVFEYGERVEVVFQGTSLVLAQDHPMHLHGFSFYVMGLGFGNFDVKKDPLKYNFVDPPLKNTIEVPRDGWVAVRFKTKNPGVWYLHCHFELHLTWGMNSVFIVKNGKKPSAQMLPPPPDMPPCNTNSK